MRETRSGSSTQAGVDQKEFNREKILEKWRDRNILPSYDEVAQALFTGERLKISFFDKRPQIYEILTKEFIQSFGNYLSDRINQIKKEKGRPIRILEVGAGDGKLTHFLKDYLEQTNPEDFSIVASDSGSLNNQSTFPVEQADYKKALADHQPDIVISSWMPPGVDFTAQFRATESVEEYLLIGEPDGAIIGDEWLTWGDSYGLDDIEEGTPAPYEQDGFTMEDLEEISKTQLCRTDNPDFRNHSSTISFRKKK